MDDSEKSGKYEKNSLSLTGSVAMGIVLDVVILGAFLWLKATSDMLVIWVALGGIVFIFAGERLFLTWKDDEENDNEQQHPSKHDTA